MKRPIAFGKYYLLERVNVGGMAEVFKAKAFGVEGFERLVAVKRILPNIAEDEEFINMFVDEAKIAVQLNHANIAQIFDLGKVEDSFFIALEYIYGKDLRAIYDRCRTQLGGPMTVAQACFVTMKTCEGLDYAHNKRDSGGKELNLVHRDVSPQNILVSYEGEVKIIDFGIAKAANKATKTQAGILKGKFGYMSPEQVRGLGLDRRSDIFSLGIILYELLTGERLFLGESDFSTLEKVRNVEILPPSTYNRKIPEELERIVLRTLAKDLEDRYQNAIDLHDELQAFLYSAGEFYSRKDLAAWMKKTFAREIDDEARRHDEYKNLTPPPRETPAEGIPVPAGSRVGRRPTAPRGAVEGEAEASLAEGAAGAEGAEPIDFTPAPVPALPDGPMTGGMAAVSEEKRRGPWILAAAALLLLCAVGAGGWLYLNREGTLHIVSEPADVRVFVDDVPQPGARTPMTLSVKPGAHVVRLEHADYQPAARSVNVPAGGAERVVVRLEAIQGAGFLVYTDPPGATVVLDDQPLPGQTPMRVSMVAVGKHKLVFKKAGFQTREETFEAKRTEQVRVDVKLASSTLTVRVESRPSGAKVTLTDGARRLALGETPLTLRDLDASGVYVVTLERAGCESWSQSLKFDGGPPPAIDAALSCRERIVDPRPRPPREPTTSPGPSEAARPPRPTGGAIGFLKINCKPWAKIIIDGRDTGLTTPQLKIPLAVGRHKITLDNPSFGVRKTITVEIAEGETNVVLEDLRNQ